MADIRNVGNVDVRRRISDVKELIDDLNAGRIYYNPRDFIHARDKLNKAFEKFIEDRMKEAFKEAKYFDVQKKNVKHVMEMEERNVISTFQRNVQRAFGEAMHTIEKALGESPSVPGKFGFIALLRLLRKRKKVGKPVDVTGYSRLNRFGKLYRIRLIPYLIMLARTATVEWDRRLGMALSFVLKTDLMRVSPHPCWLGPNVDEVCNTWRDRIISVSGLTAGFPTLEDTQREKPPLFHPNCTHILHPMTEDEQKIAVSRRIRTYRTLSKYV